MSLEFVRVKEEIDWESVENEENTCMKQERGSVANEVLHVKVENQWNSVNNTCFRVSDREFTVNEHWRVKKEFEGCSVGEGVQMKQEKEDHESEECANGTIDKELKFDTRLAEHEVKHEVFLGPEELQLQDIAYLQVNKTDAYTNSEHWGTPGCSNHLQNKDEKRTGPHTITTKPTLTDKKLKRFHQKTKSKSYLRIQGSEKVNLIGFEGQPEPRKYICDTCGQQFPRKINVIVHLRSHINQSRCVCDICHKRYSNMFNLRRHKLIHMGEKPHSCDVCNRRFTDLCNLATHMKRIHSRSDSTDAQVGKNYICKICNKPFPSPSHLNSHKRVHTGEKPYPCNVCNKLFTSASNLKRHKISHTGEKRYTCDMCNKQYMDIRALTNHIKNHMGVPYMYACNNCKKQFKDARTLDRHKQIHKGETFTCEICNKQYFSKPSFVNHKAYHKLKAEGRYKGRKYIRIHKETK